MENNYESNISKECKHNIMSIHFDMKTFWPQIRYKIYQQLHKQNTDAIYILYSK